MKILHKDFIKRLQSVSEALTYLRAFCVSCFNSLKKAILNWCLTNSSWEKTKSECLWVCVCTNVCFVFLFFFSFMWITFTRKEVYLMRCFVEEFFVRFDTTDLCVIISLCMFIESIFKSKEKKERKLGMYHQYHIKYDASLFTKSDIKYLMSNKNACSYYFIISIG